MTNNKTLNQFLFLVLCFSLISLTGPHLIKMNGIRTFKDAVSTIVFFYALFPFTFNSLVFIKLFFKGANKLLS